MITWKHVVDGLLDKSWSLQSKTFERAGPDGAIFTYVYLSNTGEIFISNDNLVGTEYYLGKKYYNDNSGVQT
uniref:Uncharacterized protein n=1 Tax=viral metagenome TaxID=1070528 RepID=A0A6C0I3T6_9ZZZZ